MQQKQIFLLLGPFISHIFTYLTAWIQTRSGILSKIISEHDHEISQSQTADKLMYCKEK